MAILMDVRTQLNYIASTPMASGELINEVRLNRLMIIATDLFEKIILPFDVPTSVGVRHERVDITAQSILVTAIDLERARISMDSGEAAVPNFRVEVSYMESEVADNFERTFARERFSDLINASSNKVPTHTLKTIFDRMENIAVINNGATRMTEDRQNYIAYIPFSAKFVITIILQCDLTL